MLKYKHTQATGKQGVNFIKRIVKTQQHDFIEIHQEDDIGLDCLVQLRKNEKPNRIISMQVKSGNSFFNPSNQTCNIPIENHREYWQSKEFPVLGVVFVPQIFRAFWCDIKKELLINTDRKKITFPATAENEFNHSNLIRYVSNMGFPDYFYIARIKDYSNKIKSIKSLFNIITIRISEIIPEILNFSDLEMFFAEIGWKFVNEKDREKIKKTYKFRTAYLSQGKITYSNDCKSLYYDNRFEVYFTERLNELSKILLNYEKLS